MNALRTQAINIIQALPDHDIEYTVNILRNILEISNYNQKKKISKEEAWETFMKGINGFTDDFMADGRSLDVPDVREQL